MIITSAEDFSFTSGIKSPQRVQSARVPNVCVCGARIPHVTKTSWRSVTMLLLHRSEAGVLTAHLGFDQCPLAQLCRVYLQKIYLTTLLQVNQ